MNLKTFVPALDWLPNYKKEWLSGDLSAGLTVGVMLIPQGMAYAMLAGLPPIHGLYAVTIPLIIYALLGTSRQLAVGPVAMVSLLVASGIGALQPATPEEYFALSLTVAFLVGVFQFLMGFFKLGFLVNFLSHPVISGFTSAAAIIIGLSQFKHLLGIKIPNSEHVYEVVLSIFEHLGETNLLALCIGIVAIVLIKGAKKIHRAIPGSLLAVAAGILAVWGFGLTEQGVKIVGEVPSGLPGFSLPSFDFASWGMLLPTVMTISLVGFMESYAVAKAIQDKHKDYEVNANQELVALGAANLGAAFFQGYAITGGFSRTAVNDQAGAKTGMASIISAVLIVLTLLFLTPLFYYLPNAVLAAVILVAVVGLIDYHEAIHLWHKDRSDFWMLLVTFVATLALGIELGIGVGVLLSLAMIIYRATKPHVAVLGKVPGSPFYRNAARFDDLEVRKDVLVSRFDGSLYFLNINYFKETLNKLVAEKGDALALIVLNAESISHIDSSAAAALRDWIKEQQELDLKVVLTTVIGPVRDQLNEWGLTQLIGEENFFMSIQQAIDTFDGKAYYGQATDYQTYTLQNN